MVPDPIFTSTHAITINAPPEQVWPLIAQMGGSRAGWYSWDLIDNGGTPSARRVVPELQAAVRLASVNCRRPLISRVPETVWTNTEQYRDATK